MRTERGYIQSKNYKTISRGGRYDYLAIAICSFSTAILAILFVV